VLECRDLGAQCFTILERGKEAPTFQLRYWARVTLEDFTPRRAAVFCLRPMMSPIGLAW
jgi:hypothetical protein